MRRSFPESRESLSRVFVCTRAAVRSLRVIGSLGIAIVSMNQGVIIDKQARKLHVGGEVPIAFLW